MKVGSGMGVARAARRLLQILTDSDRVEVEWRDDGWDRDER